MIKKLSKILVMTLMLTMIFCSSADAADVSFSFSLGNTGKHYMHISSEKNKKTILTDDWTAKIKNIYCIGNWGISLCPYKADAKVRCTRSSAWFKTKEEKAIGYASGDAALINYKVCGRQDDIYTGTFTISGKFNADNTL